MVEWLFYYIAIGMPYTINQGALTQFSNIELIARQVVEGFITGLHKSPFHGFSVEFADYRPYNTGESTRNIDWKLYGRTDKLFVKRFEEETNLRCQLVIDNSSSMYFPLDKKLSVETPNKIMFSVYAAAAIMQILRKQRDAVGLSVFSDSIEVHTHARSSQVHHKMLISELERVMQPITPDVQRKTRVTEALHEIAEKIHRRSLVVLFSDMFETTTDTEDLFLALQHLRHNKHEVMLFNVCDKSKEIDFAFENRAYKFIDMESGEEVKLHTNAVKQEYLQAAAKFQADLKLKCGQYQIELVEVDINNGFSQVLYPYLLKRSKML